MGKARGTWWTVAAHVVPSEVVRGLQNGEGRTPSNDPHKFTILISRIDVPQVGERFDQKIKHLHRGVDVVTGGESIRENTAGILVRPRGGLEQTIHHADHMLRHLEIEALLALPKER